MLGFVTWFIQPISEGCSDRSQNSEPSSSPFGWSHH